jgi:hypothetical protein
LAWFSAYAESLIDDITMLNAALTVVDQNPLGSGGLRKFVPDRQNLYHKRIGLNPEIQCCGANESENQKKSWLLMSMLPPLGQIFYGCLFVYESEF